MLHNWSPSLHFVTTNAGIEIAVYSFGAIPKRGGVLLLHGFGDCSAVWAGVIPSLLRQRPLVCLDFPGHGNSQWMADQNYSADVFVNTILDVLDDLGIEQISLIGHSLGGEVALRLVAADAQRFSSSCCIDYAIDTPASAQDAVFQNIASAFGPHASHEEYQEILQERHPLASLELLEVVSRESLKMTESGLLLKFDPELLKRRINLICNSSPIAFEIVNVLKSIKRPTLLIRGIGSAILSRAEVQRMRNIIGAHCTVVDIPAAGHSIQIENPGALCSELEKFLGH